MNFKIDKRIPVPPIKRLAGSKSAALRETLNGMHTGDSFLYPVSKGTSPSELYSIAAGLDIVVVTRKVGSGSKLDTFRVWKQ